MSATMKHRFNVGNNETDLMSATMKHSFNVGNNET
jgi:hypothetical protein